MFKTFEELGIRFRRGESLIEIIGITPENASIFAKNICGDMNPLHNPDDEDFVVPGDLLFTSMILGDGLPYQGKVQFKDRFQGNSDLWYQSGDLTETDKKLIVKNRIKTEETNKDIDQYSAFVQSFLAEYCKVSGSLFPNRLESVFEKHNLMPPMNNPEVIYTGVDYNISEDEIDTNQEISIEIDPIKSKVFRQTGLNIRIPFRVIQNDRTVGIVQKTMLGNNLVDYNTSGYRELVEKYC